MNKLVKKFTILLILLLYNSLVFCQFGKIIGYLNPKQQCSKKVVIIIDSQFRTTPDSTGCFQIQQIPFGKIHIKMLCEGIIQFEKKIDFQQDMVFEEDGLFAIAEMEGVLVVDAKQLNGMGKLNTVNNGYIVAGKKNDVIFLEKIDANLAINNARQVFSKVAGVNIWENDGSGIQMNISTRGLSPNRSWEFNMRQNGYDIAADILGYPDMYYSPSLDAVASVEIVRGAASLQYGTQLGGLLNFKLKRGPYFKPFEIESKQTIGSYGLFSSYNSIGGQKKSISYFGYYNHRSANGWRSNSDYKWQNGYGLITYTPSQKMSIDVEFTAMKFLLHLSAGLSENQYLINHQQSVRARNWFNVNWNIPAVTFNYKFTNKTSFIFNTSLLIGERNSIENTKPVNIIADTGYRDLRKDNYLNLSLEARLTSKYTFIANQQSVLACGVRYYNGQTKRGLGLGTNQANADFSFLHPYKLEYNNYTFRNKNLAFFAENIVRISKKIAIIPGFRYETILFGADGYYNTLGNLVFEKNLKSNRNFPLFGIGFEYKPIQSLNFYANATEGYRAANFNDIRITSPNLIIDPNLKDSKGFNIDLGFKLKYKNYLSTEITLFYLGYNNKIGVVSRRRADNTVYLLSTNVADAVNKGVELFTEVNLIKMIQKKAKTDLFFFVTYAYTNSRYIKSDNNFLNNKLVEYSPEHILRGGTTFKWRSFSSTINGSFVSSQFADAANTLTAVNGNTGLIPAYTLFDISAGYTFNRCKIEASVNNFTGKKYFTRRATGYPGPGIIPGDARGFSISLQVKI